MADGSMDISGLSPFGAVTNIDDVYRGRRRSSADAGSRPREVHE